MMGSQVDANEMKAAVIGERFLALARDLGGKPRKAGNDWRCPCFMHGGSGANLVLTPSAGLWHCMSSCGGGSVIDMVMRARSVEFGPALDWLAEWAAMPAHVGTGSKGWGDAKQGVAKTWQRTHVDASAGHGKGSDVPTISAALRDDCAAFLNALWRIVEDAPWSPTVARWLGDVRGTEPDAAYALGCRDWSTRRAELAELFDRTTPDVLEAVGFARDGRVHRAVLGCLRGDPTWAAMAVPVWRLGCAYPERWRWRLVTPRVTRDGGVFKSVACYSNDRPVDFLGAGRPERLEAPEVRIAHLGSGAPGSELAVLVEGEPDWLSVTEAVDGRAVVLAVCGSPSRWRDGWPDLAELARLGVRRVAVCVHHGPRSKGKDGRELGHGERFADAVAGGCARAGLAVRQLLPAEGADLNDLHCARRLRDWLAPLLEGATWATT